MPCEVRHTPTQLCLQLAHSPDCLAVGMGCAASCASAVVDTVMAPLSKEERAEVLEKYSELATLLLLSRSNLLTFYQRVRAPRGRAAFCTRVSPYAPFRARSRSSSAST